MNILKISKYKILAGLAGVATVVAVGYRYSEIVKDKGEVLLNKVLDRDNISVERSQAETLDADIITSFNWDDDDEHEDDFRED